MSPPDTREQDGIIVQDSEAWACQGPALYVSVMLGQSFLSRLSVGAYLSVSIVPHR